MATLTINGRSSAPTPNKPSSKPPRAGILDIPTLCWYPKLPVVGIAASAWCGRGTGEAAAGVRHQSGGWDGGADRVPRGRGNRKGVLRLLLERYRATSDNGGRAQPRNEFEQYVLRYGVVPRPRASAIWCCGTATSGPATR